MQCFTPKAFDPARSWQYSPATMTDHSKGILLAVLGICVLSPDTLLVRLLGMEQWPLEKVDARLKEIMANIHRQCAETAAEFDAPTNLVLGANIAGFRKVADAMIEQGVV